MTVTLQEASGERRKGDFCRSQQRTYCASLDVDWRPWRRLLCSRGHAPATHGLTTDSLVSLRHGVHQCLIAQGLAPLPSASQWPFHELTPIHLVVIKSGVLSRAQVKV